MTAGWRCGNSRTRGPRARPATRGGVELGIGTFVDEQGGYTSIAVALSLLVSLALVCSLATAAWIENRAADVQAVADATALAGSNVVAAYSTVATALDACVLTLGLAGIVTLGAGLVASAIPGLAAVGATTVDAGLKVLDARRSFATTAAKGLKAIEGALPLAIVVRSAAVAQANDSNKLDYVGCAIPFPQSSESDFSALDEEVSGEELAQSAERLQELSQKAKEAEDAADAAKLEGWLADCGGEPMNLMERASSLAGLSGAQNPFYPLESWSFGAALVRARTYYERRAAIEAPQGSGIAAITDSAARAAFYDYALAEVRSGHYLEQDGGGVDIELPSLPANTGQMRATRLYTDARWPCTNEAGGRVLHASLRCPGATGPSSGTASIAQLEAGSVSECPTCSMGATDLGKVASASTNISNGSEHYWRRIVEASQDYEAARNEFVRLERQMQEEAESSAEAFTDALEALAGPRPKLCPPGAWGCVAVVSRGAGETPEALTQAFTGAGELSWGAAVSAATLAPDNATENNDVASRLLEALGEDLGEGSAGVLGSVGRLWSSLLEGYGAAAEGLADATDKAASAIDGVVGGTPAAWLRGRIIDIVRAAGFEPADLRLRKPVLTNSQNVLDKAGLEGVSTARSLIERLPSTTDPISLARALGQEVANTLGGSSFTVAELPIPGTGITVPLTIDPGELLGSVL